MRVGGIRTHMPTAMDLQSTASSTLLRPPTLPTAGLEPTRH